MKTTTIAFLTAGLALAGHTAATAQTATADKGVLVSVNVLAQPSTRDINIANSFPIYGETASLTSAQRVSKGAVFDVAGYYKLKKVSDQLAVGVDFSTFSNSGDATGAVSVPDPLFFNRPRTVGLAATGLSHRENAVHLQVRYAWPYRDNMEVALIAGPSIFNVKQQLLAAVDIPTGTQTATPRVTDESKTAVGGNIGVEGNYYFNPRYGAGIVIRYAGASADLPSFNGLKVGGFQIGAGFRARF